MAVKKAFNIAKVARNAAENFVPPTKLASSEEVKSEVAREVASEVAKEVVKEVAREVAVQQVTATAPAKANKRKVCIIPKEKGFPMFFEEKDKERLAQISFHNGLERQNVVRTAVHLFLEKYASETGLDAAGEQLVKEYEETIYV